MNKIFEYKNIAFSSHEQIQQLQNQLLKEHIAYCKQNSPFYRNRINLNSDFKEHLFTNKSDLENFNNDFLSVSKDKVVDIVMSSGTTGKATKVMYTEHDLERLAFNEAKSFAGCGIVKNDVILLTCTIDRCFIAGLAYFSGARALGAATIRNGHGTLESHMQMILMHEPTVIVGVPSFIRKLGEYLKANGVEPALSSVKKIVCIGEPLRDSGMNFLRVAQDIESMWNVKVYSTYASSETVTTFCECEKQCGGHLHPELAIVEIIDEHDNVLLPGEVGEVVVTPMGVEGMPLVRFKTGDISFIIDKPCSCGRNSIRLGPIIGRKKQMLKIKGTTVYPQTIFATLPEVEGIADFYIEVTSQDDLSDQVDIHIALGSDKPESLSGSDMIESVKEILQSRLRVKPRVVIDEIKDLRRVVYTSKSRKPIRFIDKRGITE